MMNDGDGDGDDKEQFIFSGNFKLKKNETDGERTKRTTVRFLIFVIFVIFLSKLVPYGSYGLEMRGRNDE